MNSANSVRQIATRMRQYRRPLWVAAASLFALSVIFLPRTSSGGQTQRVNDGYGDLEALQGAFQRVVREVAPSVVGIRAERRQVSRLTGFDPAERSMLEQRVVVNGSGTIVDADGLILTNEHVVQGADVIKVMLHDGSEVTGRVLRADTRSDLAVLQIARTGLTPARICRWADVARGQWTIVVGNPFGLGSDGQLSVAVGVVSNLGRQLPGLGEVDDRFYNDMIQTTAPINPGHSGGPLFNIHGELIGVITAMHTRTPTDAGIGFAIPMTPTKRRLVQTLCRGRQVEYGYLGVTVRVPEPHERQSLKLSAGEGVVVQLVEPAGPAANGGVHVGDVIRSYQYQSVTGPSQLAELVGQTPIGSEVRVDLLRSGEPVSRWITIAQRDVSRVSWMRTGAVSWRGLRVADLNDEARAIMNIGPEVTGVLVVEVEFDSPADRANVEVGDVIDAVAGEPVRSTTDFLLRARSSPGQLDVSIRARGVCTIARR